MGTFVRRVKTASGATAVQIVHKRGRRVLRIEHIGSAHTDDEVALLLPVAEERLHGGQLTLDLGDSGVGAGGTSAMVEGTSSLILWEVLNGHYDDLGLDSVGDDVPFNGSHPVPPWVHEKPERPRVCLSLGMSGRDLFGGDQVSVGDLVTAVAELDIELVATLNTDQLATVGPLPANVRATDFVPLNDLLPTCAAIIQHGGFGTLGNVLVHGVPSLTIPAPWWDEKDLGRHLHHRHAGIHLEPDNLTPTAVTTALHHLLTDPTYQHHATTIQHEIMATPTPGDLTRQLEALATNGTRNNP